MAKQVYDDQREVTDDDLRHITGIGRDEEDQMEAGARDDLDDAEGHATNEKNVRNPGGMSAESRDNAKDLLNAENGAAAGPPTEESPSETPPSLYKGGDKKQNKGFISKLKKNKWKFILSGVGVSLPTIALFFLQTFSSVLPNLSVHIDKRLTSVTRKLVNSTNTIISQKIELERTSDPKYIEALNGYKDNGNGLLSKINRWRPTKVAEQAILGMQFNFGEAKVIPGTGGNVSRQKLISVTIDGQTIPIPENNTSLLGRIANPIDTVKARIKFKRDIRTALTTDSKLRNLAVRGKASKIVRDKIGGVRLWRWSKEDVAKADQSNDTNDKTTLDETRRTHNSVTDNGRSTLEAVEGAVGDVEEQAKQAAADQEADVANDDALRATIKAGDGVTPNVDAHLTNAFIPTKLTKAFSAASITVDLGSIMCLFYNSSMSASRAVIKANSDQAVRAYFDLTSAADAQMYTQQNGSDRRVNAGQVGGFVKQLGNVSDSVPERAANDRDASTAAMLGPQASAAGFYGTSTFTNFLNSAGTGSFTAVADPFCKAVTNVWSQGVIAGVEVLGSLVPGVGQAVKVSGEVTAKTVSSIVVREFGNLLKKSLSKKELAKLGAVQGASELAALAAKAITLQHIGAGFNGLAQGPNAVNVADAGATLFAADVDRRQNAAAPVTTAEYVKSKAADDAFLNDQEKSQSVGTRYFALSNPDSLLSHIALATHTSIHLDSARSILQTAARIFNPTTIFSRVPFFGGSRAHAIELITDTYGVLQWNWTEDEENAYLHNPDYAPLYNHKKLVESGRLDDIKAAYGKCFDSDIADLLADGDIVRDSDGNVIADQGDCSPNNLGMNNPQGYGNLVFRWRVDTRNTNAVNQLLEVENPGTDESASDNAPPVDTAGPGTVSSTGYAWPVAPQKKVAYVDIPCTHKVTYQGKQILACHHDGTPALDIFNGATGSMDNKPVYAIIGGTIQKMGPYHLAGGGYGDPRCRSLQLHGDDGYWYWYGHLTNSEDYVKNGQHVNVGQQIAQVAPNSYGSGCRGGRDHLHIDRGCTLNGIHQQGGFDSCRDPAFVPFMNDLWNRLPAN